MDWIRPQLANSGKAWATGLAMLPRTTKPPAPTNRLTPRPPTDLPDARGPKPGADFYPIFYQIFYRTGRNGLLTINTVS